MEESERNEEQFSEAQPKPMSAPVKKSKKERKPVKVPLIVMIICVLIAACITFQITFIAMTVRSDKLVNEAYGELQGFSKLRSVMELYRQYYLHDLSPEQLDEALTQGFIYGCGDRFAIYYTAEEWQAEQESAKGNGVGFGILVVQTAETGIYVQRVFPDTPAEKAGMLAGDVILSVDGVTVESLDFNDAVNRMRGEVGSTASVTVRRGTEEIVLTIVRDNYIIQAVEFEMLDLGGHRTGYVAWTEFTTIAAEQFCDAVSTLVHDGAEALVFDVRQNAGGDLNAALKMLDYLLPKGIITTIRSVDSDPEVYSSKEGSVDLPMAVLTDNDTASAAELFTIALQDYEKAKSVGTLTFGKGCGQIGFVLDDGSVVFITNFYFDSPLGKNIDGVGVTPDVEVELPEQFKSYAVAMIPHGKDTQLLAALNTLYPSLEFLYPTQENSNP